MVDVGVLIDPSTILSNLLGGLIALIVALVVSWLEVRRRERRSRENWYRQIHTLCLRATIPNDSLRKMKPHQREVMARQLELVSERVQELLVEPDADTDAELYSALQNLVVNLNIILSAVEVGEENSKWDVVEQNEHVLEYSRIVRYYIEEVADVDIEVAESLGEEYEKAVEDYSGWGGKSDNKMNTPE